MAVAPPSCGAFPAGVCFCKDNKDFKTWQLFVCFYLSADNTSAIAANSANTSFSFGFRLSTIITALNPHLNKRVHTENSAAAWLTKILSYKNDFSFNTFFFPLLLRTLQGFFFMLQSFFDIVNCFFFCNFHNPSFLSSYYLYFCGASNFLYSCKSLSSRQASRIWLSVLRLFTIAPA